MNKRTSFLLGACAVAGALLGTSVLALGGTSGATMTVAKPTAIADTVAFGRARDSSDALSPAAAAALQALLAAPAPSAQLDPGAPLFAQSRRALKTARADMYLVPTAKGHVCYVLTPSGLAGCSDGSKLATDAIEWGLYDHDGIGVGTPTVVHGLVRADVTAVQVTAGGTSHSVDVSDGAFYLEVDGLPEKLVVTRRDGRSSEFRVPAPPVS